jgi:hypothetical protein
LAAVELRDGGEYRIALGERARVCVQHPPPAAADPVACEGVKPLAQAPPEDERTKVIALGAVRIGDGDAAPAALLSLTLSATRYSAPPTPETAGAFAAGMASSVTRQWPGSSVRAGAPTARIATVAGVPVVRIAMDVDGLSADGHMLEHTIAYVVWSLDGPYAFSLSTPSASAAAIDALADEAGATIRLAHPALPPEGSRAAADDAAQSYRYGRIAGSLIVPLVLAGVAVLVLGRRRGPPKARPPEAQG